MSEGHLTADDANALRLDRKVVAITGAASGIGRATALVAGLRGASLVLGDRDAELLEDVGSELSRMGVEAARVALDVTKPSSVDAFVDAAVDRHGRIDGLVCSAGTSSSAPAVELSLDDWQRIIAVNLTGTFLPAQAAARVMIDTGTGGSIVAVSSALAFTGQRLGSHYTASKGGVVGLVKSLAMELGPNGIRVNNVAPGATDSPLLRRIATEEFLEGWVGRNPMGRLGRPEDQAKAICFLLSDASEWITGQTFHVNGGSIMP